MTRRLVAMRAGLWLSVTLLLVAPFAVSWALQYRDNVADQVITPPTPFAKEQLAGWREAGEAAPERTAPVVLAYHDIRPDPGKGDLYVVTPEQFDLQLTALAEAGYRTITSDEYVTFLRGGELPPRSVYLTFDDGTGGLWRYADPILARHNMHAAAYIITSRVDTHRPYYLSWPEIDRMVDSGRWDFQAHSHDLHTRSVISPDGTLGSPVVHRLYDPVTGVEKLADYRARIRTDFDALFAEFAAHGLPRPDLFAYPFSEIGDAEADPAAAQAGRSAIESRFVAALTNKTRSPAPSSRRSAASKEIARIEVKVTTTVDEFLSRTIEWTQAPPSVNDAYSEPWRWRDRGNKQLETLVGFAGGAGETYASFAPYTSADWTDYLVTTTAHGLTGSGDYVTIGLRVGSDAPIEVKVTNVAVVILQGTTELARADLPFGPSHRIAATVTEAATSVTIDDQVTLSVPNRPGPTTTGGIALGVSGPPPTSDRPMIDQPIVSPLM